MTLKQSRTRIATGLGLVAATTLTTLILAAVPGTADALTGRSVITAIGATAGSVTRAGTAAGNGAGAGAAATNAYTQEGDTVTVYRSGHSVATLTLTTATYDGHTGQLSLKISAGEKFRFTAGQFIWEDPDGGDNTPIHPGRVVTVAANHTRTVTINYHHVGKGDIIWAPSSDQVVGIWLVPASGEITGRARQTVGYSQEGDTVTVYRGGESAATVTLKSVTYDAKAGQLVLQVKATRSLRLADGQFIWEDPKGADTAPLHPSHAVRVKANHSRTITIDYRNVGKGDVIWSPTEDSVAGIWDVPAN
jgi:hypothetical protein